LRLKTRFTVENAFVMETSRKFARWRSSVTALRLLACLALVVPAGCGAPKDKNDRRPEAVVEAFVKAVTADDFTKAASFWKQGALENIEANYGMSFREFCRQQFVCDSYRLSRATKQKGQYYSVDFRCMADGQERTFMFYLELVGGEWLLEYDLWVPKEPVGRVKPYILIGNGHTQEFRQ
jgi:hypothetical protein